MHPICDFQLSKSCMHPRSDVQRSSFRHISARRGSEGGYRGICGARRGKRQSDFWTVDGHWLRAARWYLSTVDQVVNFQLVVSFDPYFCETHIGSGAPAPRKGRSSGSGA